MCLATLCKYLLLFITCTFHSSRGVTVTRRPSLRRPSLKVHSQIATSTDILAEKDDAKITQWIRENSNNYKKSELFGNYAVDYSGSGSQQRGAPAGGNFRGGLGKIILESTGLFQNLCCPSYEDRDVDVGVDVVVVNQVSGRLFRLLPMHVVLYGVARFLDSNQRNVAMETMKSKEAGVTLSDRSVEAVFEPPRIMICFGELLASLLTLIGFDLTKEHNAGVSSTTKAFDIVFQIGPSSNVVLDTPYCDATLRSGVGARGSGFLFRRLLEKDPQEYSHSEVWRTVMNKRTISLRNVAVAMSFGGAYFGLIGRRLLGFALSLAGVGLAYWKGGM